MSVFPSPAEQQRVTRAWFDCWLMQNAAPLPNLLAPDIFYSECYGPVYHGLTQVQRWFSDWNRENLVLQWDIVRFVSGTEADGTPSAAVEWSFSCRMGAQDDASASVHTFNGVSLLRFTSGGLLSEVKEFESRAAHTFPYDTLPDGAAR